MDIEVLKARVYYLVGALDEAKKLFEDAVKEIQAQEKKVNEDKAAKTE